MLRESQTALFDRALSIRERTVADEMTPWSDVATISGEVEPHARLEQLPLNYTRLPVVDMSNQVCGVLSLLDAVSIDWHHSRARLCGTDTARKSGESYY